MSYLFYNWLRNSRTLVGMLLVGCRQKATEFYLFGKCESYERYKTFVCTNKVICHFNPERLPEILVTFVAVSLFKCFSSSQPAPSINQSTNQFIYAMTWDWVARSIRAGSSFLCLGDFCKKGEKKIDRNLWILKSRKCKNVCLRFLKSSICKREPWCPGGGTP